MIDSATSVVIDTNHPTQLLSLNNNFEAAAQCANLWVKGEIKIINLNQISITRLTKNTLE